MYKELFFVQLREELAGEPEAVAPPRLHPRDLDVHPPPGGGLPAAPPPR